MRIRFVKNFDLNRSFSLSSEDRKNKSIFERVVKDIEKNLNMLSNVNIFDYRSPLGERLCIAMFGSNYSFNLVYSFDTNLVYSGKGDLDKLCSLILKDNIDTYELDEKEKYKLNSRSIITWHNNIYVYKLPSYVDTNSWNQLDSILKSKNFSQEEINSVKNFLNKANIDIQYTDFKLADGYGDDVFYIYKTRKQFQMAFYVNTNTRGGRWIYDESTTTNIRYKSKLPTSVNEIKKQYRDSFKKVENLLDKMKERYERLKRVASEVRETKMYDASKEYENLLSDIEKFVSDNSFNIFETQKFLNKFITTDSFSNTKYIERYLDLLNEVPSSEKPRVIENLKREINTLRKEFESAKSEFEENNK